MKEQNTSDEAIGNLMALYDIRIQGREDQMAVMKTTFLSYCENHIHEDGFEKDAIPFLLVLYERKESLKALRQERDILCGKA